MNLYQRLKSTGKLLDVHIVVRQISIAIGGELYGKSSKKEPPN